MTVAAAAPGLTGTSPNFGSIDESTPKKRFNQLLPHTLVSTDFDDLKFNAAASLQLKPNQNEQGNPASAESDTRLIASPYNDAPHLLDLKTLDTQSRLLALALAFFKPIHGDYATADYLDSFNWVEVFDLLKGFSETEGHPWTTQTFYVVSFRSQLKPNVDQDRLHALDAYSHQEAVASGGLLKYWFGTKNDKEQNLATCIWRSRNDARLGGLGPWHAKARAAAKELYEEIVFTTMKLVIEDEFRSWEISDWTDQEAV
ncbi:uncharacterized protein N7459_003494 [Penicillium hispanicum]|uniref:uncharacterized protein n=1 Tax=Penicillium hispanicum TaxID=1080232 RepID=UPI0025414391|nr:uncharacterized protein N7459_003494 [Penicillium hispanicum]KAJ5587729.1 hypothetical protein N7459_003494 [Penicillium hispanicum]